MNPETKPNWLVQNCKSALQRKVNYCNTVFNKYSKKTRQAIMIVIGISMAAICTTLILQAIYGQSITPLPIDEITIPKDMYKDIPETEKLTPIGKMKGEMDGKFEAFHIAVDKESQLFINHDPEFSKDSLNKSKGWEPITRQQLEVFEKQLHFIPHRKKGLSR